MDLDKIRKINELAKNLQKHNIAINSLDATESAKEIFEERKQDIDAYQPQTQTNQQQTENTGSTTLLERRYQLLLEQNNQKFSEELKSLKETVDSLSFQVLNLRSELVKLNNTPRELPKPAETTAVNTAPQPQQQPVSFPPLPNTSQAPPKESHPRQGNYKSEDVAIDKFFYFGRKKS